MFPGSSAQVTCSIPLPEDSPFTIKYYLDYQALRIPSTVREIPYAPTGKGGDKREESFIYLQGVGPKVRLFGRDVRFCDKEASFEVLPPPGKKAIVKLRLFSPFDFANAYWYGNYAQQVRILLENGRIIEQPLGDGANAVAFDLDRPAGRQGPFKVWIEFRYHLLFDFANLRKTAALLEGAGIE
jgi:hypothetical protein